MITVYVYVLDTLADWEIGHVTAELKSRRFFKKDAPEVLLKTVGDSLAPIRTMGGILVVPDCRIDDIAVSDASVLLLPGSNAWNDAERKEIVDKARDLLVVGGTVCAICGATTALASAGLLDARSHTSNGPGFLDMFVPHYKGQDFYVDEPSVADGNLITASSVGGLPWAKDIIEHLGVFRVDTLEAWFKYFTCGKPEQFYALMQTLPASDAAQE